MKTKINLKIFLLILLFYQALFLTCDENEIENCFQCGSEENKGRCTKCDDKYFLVLNGEKCIACDNEFLGQEGCDGNCEFMMSEKNIFCDKCKDDYYYELSEGICAPCSYSFDNCLKCSYLKESEDSEEKVFKCLECDDSYYLSDNECKKCDDNCKKCLDANNCETCDDNYIRHPNGHCVLISDKFCLEAEYTDDEYREQKCNKCKEGYILNSYSGKCESCEGYLTDYRGCKKCRIKENNEFLCEKAVEYVDYSNKIYSYCENFIEGCNKCSFHSEEDLNNDNLLCDECRGYYSAVENKCKECRNGNNGCLICSDEENGECDKCQEGYYFFQNNKTCAKCSDFFQEGCSSCALSPYTLNLYCSKCSEGNILDRDGKCKHCINDLNLRGCETCNVAGLNHYFCEQCNENYILFQDICIEKNEDISEFVNCNSLENLGTLNEIVYSCKSCKSGYIYAIKENGVKICIDPSGYPELKNCQITKIGKNGENDYSCISCYSDINFYGGLELFYDDKIQKKHANAKKAFTKMIIIVLNV